jgi:hypothetical protein
MEWVYQDVVVETVDWFARRAIPDSGDWHGERYRIQQVAMIGGSAWDRVAKVGVGTFPS